LAGITDEFSFACGAVRRNGLGYVALANDTNERTGQPTTSAAALSGGQWISAATRPWPSVGVAIALRPVLEASFVGPLGEVLLSGPSGTFDEQVGDAANVPAARGTIRTVREVSGLLFVAGMDRQVYRRDHRNVWRCIDQSMRPENDQVIGFESIHGYSAEQLYAVGWEGEIWHYDGLRWHRVDSPTNHILTCVECASDGWVYACGRFGTLLRGREDRWEMIRHASTELDLWSVCFFKGTLFVSTMRGVFALKDNALEPVNFGADSPTTTYRLTCVSDLLWSIGAKDIFAFDGAVWSRLA